MVTLKTCTTAANVLQADGKQLRDETEYADRPVAKVMLLGLAVTGVSSIALVVSES
jgi:hypothetical protein